MCSRVLQFLELRCQIIDQGIDLPGPLPVDCDVVITATFFLAKESGNRGLDFMHALDAEKDANRAAMNILLLHVEYLHAFLPGELRNWSNQHIG